MKSERQLSASVMISAIFFALAVLVVGYRALGLLPMFLFAFGFLGGLFLWLLVPTNASFGALRAPFFVTLVCFVLHKLEERFLGFFPALSEITGVPVPESGSLSAILLYAFAGAWLFIPILVRSAHQFGYFLAWSFFTSMGVTELAHFIFPFFTAKPYSYFPGMLSVLVLAPAAWWGMWRLCRATEHGERSQMNLTPR